MKKTIKTLAVLLTIFGVLYLIFYLKSTSKSFVRYLKENPNNYSLVAQLDTTVVFNHNPTKKMTLASTMKIIIAIEFAYQIAENKFKSNEMVSIKELDKFFVPYTDGGAHEKWLDEIFEKYGDKTTEVSILDVAKGMIAYSSNANSEYLLDKLTVEKVNNRIDSLQLTNHEDIHYFVSSLFLDSKTFTNEKQNIFSEKTDSTHLLLKNGKINLEDFEISDTIETEWGNKLPKSTTQDYASIMEKINYDSYFPKDVHNIIKQLMEWPMKFPKNKDLFYYIGGKGGNTSSVMTYASYGYNKEGNKSEICIFVSDLSFFDGLFLRKAMNKFMMDFLKSKETRDELIKLYNE